MKFRKTSAKEDADFEALCREKKCTFLIAMQYMRKFNPQGFRRSVIQFDVPIDIKERVRLQCKLEGLI